MVNVLTLNTGSSGIRWGGGLILALGLPGASLPLAPAPAQAKLCPAQLAPRIEAVLNQAPLDVAYTGLLLETQASLPGARQTLYSRNADRLFTPASNVKLLTTAAALHYLGASHRIRTSVYGVSGSGGLTALRVVGRGDPTLGSTQLEDLARQLTQAGVSQVSQLVLDDSYFPGFATNPTWEWEDAQADYGVPVNSLILNQNAVTVQVAPAQVGQPLTLLWPQSPEPFPWPVLNHTLTVATAAETRPISLWRSGESATLRATGQLVQSSNPVTLGLAVLDPAQRFGLALEEALADQGIAVAQTSISSVDNPLAGAELAAIESPTLAELIIPANQESNNLYAEALLKTLGVNYSTPPVAAEASRAGTAAVKSILEELGVPTEPLRLADGSGLSRHNLVTPTALVETLQVMANHPQAEVFRDSLAIAGVSGTLARRLQGSPLVGRFQGKSGAITGNVSLSGYVQPPAYEPLVFSIIINHANQPASLLREKIDVILELIGQLSPDC
ncbi:MAG: D-alanyl-D-alanine carboxypeptidase/D-alanyl-D-alanine-endopeptidase [Leptolyngbyaceae cyanobacterium SM2_3_12]|nr:D-alanyl-D-alanine carboxypeptidase/D-alanyl-D-alanine-endopeptidase [Leptolyngbyaceae cyanobacterium SM2_3_12]